MSQTYRDRNILLKSLGFRNYHQYLKSRIWKAIKACTLKRLGRVCSLCKKKGHTIHHLDYSLKTLVGQSPSSLVIVCKRCHHDIEFTDSSNGKGVGRKRTLMEVQRVYKNKLKNLSDNSGNKGKKVRYCACGRVAHAKFYYCPKCLNSGKSLGRM